MTGEVTLKEGVVEMVMPGDTVTFKVKLVGPIAMEDQMRFAIREGGKNRRRRCRNEDRRLIHS